MIPRTLPTWQSLSWQEELSRLITEPKQLFELLQLDASLLHQAEAAHTLFPLRTTLSYASRIKRGNKADPLLRQILPMGEEFLTAESFTKDPLKESEFSNSPGLIHKYSGRVLLIAAAQCAINCRYCFRRHFDYSSNTPSGTQWQEALTYIDNDTSIEEVILSGGDPLVVSDKQLAWLINALEKIPHIQRLRIHTRLPIVLPSRMTDKLLALLCQTPLQVIMVTHCNHPQEIDNEVFNTLKTIQQTGLTLLNQTVLLKGVNDTPETLITLSKQLFASGILPYYLHLLDKVSGASHFEVNTKHARALYQSLLAKLPGYLVPKLVKEVPNAASKVPII